MADTFLTPIIHKLIDLLAQELTFLKSIHVQAKSLTDELHILEPFLRDAEAKSARGDLGDAVKVWLKQLREECDRIEDVIDECDYRSARKTRCFFGDLKRRHNVASEIRNIDESLRRIKDRGLSYGLRPFDRVRDYGSSNGFDSRLASLFLEDRELVGLDSKSRVLEKSITEGAFVRTVISIVGEGGIGKTALARKVYNDVVSKGFFDCHVWITVSQSCDTETILKRLRNRICICSTTEQSLEIEQVVSLLRRSLETKSYIVVFDDVWEPDFWSVVKHSLPDNGKKSRIILTTRNALVAESFIETSFDVVHEIKALSKKQSWELFCKKAFSRSDCSCPVDLEPLAHEILSKCQGLPLAIVAVAGVLSKKYESKLEWQRLLERFEFGFEEYAELSNVLKILLLSYHDLPYHLKLCLLYFAIPPEDFLIHEGTLYSIWIAEGFIKPRRGKTLEHIAEEYLAELINRNLVLSELWFGSQRMCKVHDLTREMLLTRMNHSRFCQIFERGEARFEGKSRRLSVHGTAQNVLRIDSISKIRSVALYNTDESTDSFVIGLFKKCRLLKVLDLSETPLTNLPKEVGKLFHLKYLCLRDTKIKMLPKSIGKLHNLQSLDVLNTFVQELPVEINELKNLRHLRCCMFDEQTKTSFGIDSGARIHQGFGRLESLQTLGNVKAHSSRVDLAKELQNLRKLTCLSVSKLTSELGKALGRSIEAMTNLEILYLSAINEHEAIDFDSISSPPLVLRHLHLISRLQRFPSWVEKLHNLQGLELKFSSLISDPLESLRTLPNLAFLCLHRAYLGEELHFKKDGFEKLKQLELRALERLKALKIDKGALRVLEKLVFGPFPLMNEMPSDIQHLTSLKSLKINDMTKEFAIALQPERGNDHWKIQHIGRVCFSYNQDQNHCRDMFKLGSSDF